MFIMNSILIVDDDQKIGAVLSEILQTKGFSTIQASGGRQALEQMREAAPDVILLDLKMPGMDGLQLLQEIRKTGSKTDVIMVTAYGEVESYLKAMSLGAAEYINKPIRIKELKRIVHKVLTEQQARSGS